MLVVDDNATNRFIFEETLQSFQMSPVVVDSAAAARAALLEANRRGRPIKLALIDVMMPDEDGFSLIESINSQSGEVGSDLQRPILIVASSGVEAGERKRAADLGVAQFLVKPVIQSDLLDAILKVFGSRSDEPVDAAPEPDNADSLHILLAEDSVINQRVAAGLLSRWGHRVDVVSDGRDAVEALARQRYDLVLMDVHMPDMDGLEATALIRSSESETGCHTPIIAMTASAMKGDRERFLAAGMDEYVSKPFEPEVLRELILSSASAHSRKEGVMNDQPTD